MDQQSFTVQLLSSGKMLYRISCALLRSEEDRKDALQETALKAWTHRDQLREEQYFKTWISRILINECRQICRETARMIPVEEIHESMEQVSDGQETELRCLLENLPERLRVPIVLHYLEGFTLEEIAQVQHLTVSMVKYLMYQARKRLRVELDGKDGANQ